jgi:hypothetical protein
MGFGGYLVDPFIVAVGFVVQHGYFGHMLVYLLGVSVDSIDKLVEFVFGYGLLEFAINSIKSLLHI